MILENKNNTSKKKKEKLAKLLAQKHQAGFRTAVFCTKASPKMASPNWAFRPHFAHPMLVHLNSAGKMMTTENQRGRRVHEDKECRKWADSRDRVLIKMAWDYHRKHPPLFLLPVSFGGTNTPLLSWSGVKALNWAMRTEICIGDSRHSKTLEKSPQLRWRREHRSQEGICQPLFPGAGGYNAHPAKYPSGLWDGWAGISNILLASSPGSAREYCFSGRK